MARCEVVVALETALCYPGTSNETQVPWKNKHINVSRAAERRFCPFVAKWKIVLKTHQADSGVAVRVSYPYSIGNSDEPPQLGLMCLYLSTNDEYKHGFAVP